MVNDEKKMNTNEVSLGYAEKILIEPWITEAATVAIELNKYVFKVSSNATKAQIKNAIEAVYKVTVTGVNVVNISRKRRNYGRTLGWKSGYRKAIVTVKIGDKIELFKGV